MKIAHEDERLDPVIIAEAVITVILIAPYLALTAKHIVGQCEKAYGPVVGEREASHDFVMHAIKYGSKTVASGFSVAKIFCAGGTDIAVLHLRADASALPAMYPRISLLPPRAGDKIFAFGYAGNVSGVEPDQAQVDPNGHTSTGEILEVFPQKRDSVLAPFPCFRTNARFDDAMSGAPVFDEQGCLCGLVCSSMPPSNPEEEHSSLVTLLWPVAGLEIEVPWREHPEWPRYKMHDLFVARGEGVVGLDRLVLLDGKVGMRMQVPSSGE